MTGYLPKPRTLIKGDYCEGESLDAIGWLLHHLEHVPMDVIENDRRRVAREERKMAARYGWSMDSLKDLTKWNDSLDDRSRVVFFAQWCKQRGFVCL